MGETLKAGIVGAIVLFIWSMVSWMYLPWHYDTIHSFKDEKAITDVIQAQVTESGVYSYPAMTKDAKPQAVAPQIFASVSLRGTNASMVIPMIISFITQLITALLVGWMLSKTHLSYVRRVLFVTIFGLAGAIASKIPLWNWFGFDSMFTLVNIADVVISWFLAGIFMALVCGRQYS